MDNKGGAPIGNQNAKKGKAYRDAIRHVLAMAEVDGWEPVKPLEKIVYTAYKKAILDGDMQAINHFADRLDGRPVQTVAGDEEQPLTAKVTIERITRNQN